MPSRRVGKSRKQKENEKKSTSSDKKRYHIEAPKVRLTDIPKYQRKKSPNASTPGNGIMYTGREF